MVIHPKKDISKQDILDNYLKNNTICSSQISKIIKKDTAYVHCIGEEGIIQKYTVYNGSVEKGNDRFRLLHPNISQLHILIDDVKDDYIYLKSEVKFNDSVKEGRFVKCSLSSRKCEYYNKKEITNVDNVNICISDILLTGAIITIKDTNDPPFIYGEWYRLEKENNREWFPLDVKIENYGFNDIGYLMDSHNEVKFVIDREILYGKLSLGSYRIVKEGNHQYISVDFEIGDTIGEHMLQN